jgi:hypothetical protein
MAGLLGLSADEAEEKREGIARSLSNDRNRKFVSERGLEYPGRSGNLMRVPIQNLTSYVPDAPSTDMLRPMQIPELDNSTRQALAIEVEDVLGYTPLRKDVGAPSKLQLLLAMLDITAFDPKSVTEYKERMQKHHQQILNTNPKTHDRFFGYNGVLMSSDNMWFVRRESFVAWSMTSLSSYDKPVPEFVLRKCVEIKKQAPEANFWVDELREQQRTIDPFLWVTLGNADPNQVGTVEFAAIEVWGEPEFEKSL